MDSDVIYICPNNHYFLANKLSTLQCPFCGELSVSTIEYQDGDCVECGQLCPAYAYGCNSPNPIKTHRNKK